MDPLAQALEAFKSGDSDTLSSLMNDEAPQPAPQEEIPEEQEALASEEVPAPDSGEAVETEEPQEDASVGDDEVEAQAAPQLPDTEEITITDDSGRRQYTIDYTDRTKIRKAFEYAAGFRKMQARADTAAKETKELKESYSKLEDAWGDGGIDGIKGVITALGGDSAVKEFIDAEVAERHRIESMSPEEREAHDRKREEEARRLEWETKVREIDARESAYKQRVEREEQDRLSSYANTALDKYNFNGRLGDEKAEGLWNKMVWTNAIELLEKHSSEDTKLTQSNFLKAFEVAHANLSRQLVSQVSRQVDKQVDKKKAATAKDAAAAAKRSMAGKPTAAQDINADIDNGDIASGIKKLFGSTKKLF